MATAIRDHVTVVNHGSIALLTPITVEAREWCDEHIPGDALMWGRSSIVVEPRYLQDILAGMALDLDGGAG